MASAPFMNASRIDSRGSSHILHGVTAAATLDRTDGAACRPYACSTRLDASISPNLARTGDKAPQPEISTNCLYWGGGHMLCDRENAYTSGLVTNSDDRPPTSRQLHIYPFPLAQSEHLRHGVELADISTREPLRPHRTPFLH